MPEQNYVTQNANGGFSATGSVAVRMLQSGFNTNSLRTLDVLRHDEWKTFDSAIIEVAKQRLVGVQDLLDNGLRFDIANGLGKTRLEWETSSDMEPANISMSGVTPGENDRVEFNLQALPLPIIHKDFNINIRALSASRELGESLDTTQARLSTRRVAEKTEDMLFNGETLNSAGATITGYTTAANRNTGSLSGDWGTHPTVDGEDMLADVIDMITALINDKMFGPYVLYIPTIWMPVLDNDFKTNSDRTIRERLLAIPEITAIRGSSNLSTGGAGEVVLVQMTSDVVDEVIGMQPAPLMWETQGGLIVNFKVMSIMIPRMKSDAEGQSGIAHFSV